MKKIFQLDNIIIIAIFLVLIMFQCNNTKKIKEDKKRLETNLFNINKEIDSTRTKNNELMYSVSSLTLEKNEFKRLNAGLSDEIDDMKIKLKNVQYVTKIVTETEYIIDTQKIFIYKLFDNNFELIYNDNNWIELNMLLRLEKIDTTKNESIANTMLAVDSLSIKSNHIFTIANENIYKGWWFWRKVVETKLHIKSNNPYVTINEATHINFKK